MCRAWCLSGGLCLTSAEALPRLSLHGLRLCFRAVGKITKKVIGDVENGDIILMHDEFAESVEAAFLIIDNLLAKGYTFVTVDELMID